MTSTINKLIGTKTKTTCDKVQTTTTTSQKYGNTKKQKAKKLTQHFEEGRNEQKTGHQKKPLKLVRNFTENENVLFD